MSMINAAGLLPITFHWLVTATSIYTIMLMIMILKSEGINYDGRGG